MKMFMDKDFLLTTDTARKLFHEYADKQPIVDYHCHLNPQEIAEDRHFENITQVWLGGDHYKWRLMRSAGIDERYITGDATDREKFQKWAEVLSKSIGNPLFHWSHLELQRYFGYTGILSGDTAEEVWQLCGSKLVCPEMSTKNLIKRSGVKVICTTDDPVDSLKWHKLIAEDESFDVKVLPAWRPDKAMNIEKSDFSEYIERLSKVSGICIKSFSDLKKALVGRMSFFAEMGCCISDHGLEYIYFSPAKEEETERIFTDKMSGKEISNEDIKKYKTEFMLFMGREYSRLGWAMQLHYGVKRDNNTAMYKKIGADTGYDCIGSAAPQGKTADFLNALEADGKLPKTILYSLNPNDNQAIDTIMGCFQNSEAIGKIQHGSAWWFNDNKTGMREQLISLANLGYLAGFIGMLTDSRSFLSYPRHEYFRRILCGLMGEWVENGEYPCDMKLLGEIVSDISYGNAKRYFGF